MDPATTTVRIFGQEYAIRSENDPEYVRRVAALVDEKMREVADASAQVTSVRVAILAALNLADEVLQSREKGHGADEELEARARRLAQALEATILSEEARTSSHPSPADPEAAEAEGS